MTTVRAVDVTGQAHELRLFDTTIGGGDAVRRLRVEYDRHGDGWTVGDLVLYGRHGAHLARASLTVPALRELAAKASRLADFTEARARGDAGPCLCSAWAHNLAPCPNPSRLDYSMCPECWPAGGQSALTSDHGLADYRAAGGLAVVR